MKAFIALLQVAIVIFVFCGSILFPAICTFRIWRRENRLVLFIIDTKRPRESELENQCWKQCHQLSMISMLTLIAFAATLIFDHYK